MKYFIAIALIATVASAAITKPTAWASNMDEIQQIIAAINSPSTNPATAAALEDMLLDVLGVNAENAAVGPAVVEAEYEPISVGPALVDFPLPEGGAIAAPVMPTPAEVSPVAAAADTPLVQIILNINQAAGSSPVAVTPIAVPEAVKPEPVHVVEFAPTPVHIVESAPTPVQVVETAPTPVQVVDTAPTPVQVIEAAPIPAEPVIIGTPILPSPAVVLPETLN